MEKDPISAIRRRILELSCDAKSAHVGSSLSCVEILYTLFEEKYRKSSGLEKIVFSKGHAAMGLYGVAESFGFLKEEELQNYFKDGSLLWGHPAIRREHPFIDWSTGSLGHGLPVAAGFAYTRKVVEQAPGRRVAAVLSDGECDEGTVWEAALFAGHHRLRNLLAVIDYNKIQSFGTVKEVLDLEPFRQKWEAFNWNVIEADGHSLPALREAYSQSQRSERPTCLIAHTVKGKGIPDFENTLLSHYRPVSGEQLESFCREK